MIKDANYYIRELNMSPHPEGGYYVSTYSSSEDLERDGQARRLYTSIYFLLQPGDISHFHRLKSDEVWYYHAGSPLTVHMIDEKGTYTEVKLGLSVHEGEQPQAVVESGTIFGSSLGNNDEFALVGCMVAPGFDFKDFELFTQDELLAAYPDHHEIIMKMAYKQLPEQL